MGSNPVNTVPYDEEDDSEKKIYMIERYLSLADSASMWSGYPVGGSYIDSRCGVGFGMPNIHDYVEYDHEIARAIPDIRGMQKSEVIKYLGELKKEI